MINLNDDNNNKYITFRIFSLYVINILTSDFYSFSLDLIILFLMIIEDI